MSAGNEDHHLTKRFKLSGISSELILLETAEKAALERHLQTLQDGIEARAITKVLADSEPLGVQATNRLDSLINATAHTGNASPRAPISYRADLLENVEITDTVFLPKEGLEFQRMGD